MRELAVTVGLLVPFWPALLGQSQKQEPPRDVAPPPIDNPMLFLIRHRSVQDELHLRDYQKKSLRRLLDDEIDGPLWALRDAGHEQGGQRRRELEAKAQAALKGILDRNGLKRLDELVLQYQGLEALLLPEIALKLKLSPDQKKKVRQIYDDAKQAIEELNKQPASGEKKDIAAETHKLRKEERDKLVDTLTEQQKKQWNELLGTDFDFAQLQWPGPIKAPELAAATAWLNTKPLTLAKLRGRVVVLHFWTFG